MPLKVVYLDGPAGLHREFVPTTDEEIPAPVEPQKRVAPPQKNEPEKES